jgi:hypothetical protein
MSRGEYVVFFVIAVDTLLSIHTYIHTHIYMQTYINGKKGNEVPVQAYYRPRGFQAI